MHMYKIKNMQSEYTVTLIVSKIYVHYGISCRSIIAIAPYMQFFAAKSL